MERPDIDMLKLTHGENELTPSCSPGVRALISYSEYLERRLKSLRNAIQVKVITQAAQIKEFEDALMKIGNEDYRGNRPASIDIAQAALKKWAT